MGSGLNALGVVRSLAPEDITITVLDSAPGGPAMDSRFAQREFIQPAGGGDLIAHLAARPMLGDPPFLFLTQEASVATVSAQRAQLEGKYRFLLPPKDNLAQLMDKSRFQTLASDLGFPVPRSVILSDASSVDAAAQLTYPCILKPVAKSEAWEHRYQKAYRFETFERLRDFLLGIGADVPALIVQEWIEGTDSDVYFTLVYRDDKGRTCASFTGRKIRQWPPQVGGTASCVAAPDVDAVLSELTTRFFDAVGFVGMGSMEYKRDTRSGRFVMVEPTVGRTDYQEEVATLNGVNVVRAAYRSQAGLAPLGQGAPSRKKIWRDANADERSRIAQPALKVPVELSGIESVDAVFRMNDPGPWLADLKDRVMSRFARLRS
ncbi:MAG: FAD-dependent oxidoreductase [Alphaproteobacteria bacterium]|nr:FAD-dependent oxidoreductase [Alphaproteobacteria bacterium]